MGDQGSIPSFSQPGGEAFEGRPIDKVFHHGELEIAQPPATEELAKSQNDSLLAHDWQSTSRGKVDYLAMHDTVQYQSTAGYNCLYDRSNCGTKLTRREPSYSVSPLSSENLIPSFHRRAMHGQIICCAAIIQLLARPD